VHNKTRADALKLRPARSSVALRRCPADLQFRDRPDPIQRSLRVVAFHPSYKNNAASPIIIAVEPAPMNKPANSAAAALEAPCS
jgi:hypothetical protein